MLGAQGARPGDGHRPIIDRIISQVLYITGIKGAYGIDVSDPKYRKRWCASNMDSFLHSMLPAVNSGT